MPLLIVFLDMAIEVTFRQFFLRQFRRHFFPFWFVLLGGEQAKEDPCHLQTTYVEFLRVSRKSNGVLSRTLEQETAHKITRRPIKT